MILLIALAPIVVGLFVVQVLKTVDMPRYRPVIFKSFVALTAWSAGVSVYGGLHLGSGAVTASLLLIGAVSAVAFGMRSHHWHVIRHEFDLPPHLGKTETSLEGPSAQAARRKRERA